MLSTMDIPVMGETPRELFWATASHWFKCLEHEKSVGGSCFSSTKIELNWKTLWTTFMSKPFLNYHQKIVMLTSWCYPESIFPSTVTESSHQDDFQPNLQRHLQLAREWPKVSYLLVLAGHFRVANLSSIVADGHHFAAPKKRVTPTKMEIF